MPRARKTIVANRIDIQPTSDLKVKVPPTMTPKTRSKKEDVFIPIAGNKEIVECEKETHTKITPKNDVTPAAEEMQKIKFKASHKKANYWLENDIYQTILDISEGDKEAKASIINQALKDYFKKHKIAIKPLRDKEKKA